MGPDHAKLIDHYLSAHGTIVVAAVGAFFAYSDRTDGFSRSLSGIAKALTELRRRICADLADRLTPLFEKSGSVPLPLIVPDGGTYIERAINPVGSEAFKEIIREFLDSNAPAVLAYRSLTHSRDKWCIWSRRLCTLILCLIVWQLLVLGALFLDKVGHTTFADHLLHWTWAPTLLLIACAAVSMFIRLSYYWKLNSLRMEHGEL